jgi:hypothetical protein
VSSRGAGQYAGRREEARAKMWQWLLIGGAVVLWQRDEVLSFDI